MRISDWSSDVCSSDLLPLTVLMAALLLLVWRCLLRPSVRELAPTWVAGRLPAAWDTGAAAGLRETLAISGGRASWPQLALVIVSLAIGVLTHIVWDLFTHAGRGGVDLLPGLAERWGPVPGSTWLQHGSSLLGLVVLGVWGLIWISRRGVEPVARLLQAAVRVRWGE